MSTENPRANSIVRYDLTGNGTQTDSGITITDNNEVAGQVMAFGGDRMSDHLNQEDSGTFIVAPAGTVALVEAPLFGTHFYFLQNSDDPMTVAVSEGSNMRIYLGTTETTAIVSNGKGSTCLLIYAAENVWQGLFSGHWTVA